MAGDRLADATDVGGDHGPTRCHRLDHRVGESFGDARGDHEGAARIRIRDRCDASLEHGAVVQGQVGVELDALSLVPLVPGGNPAEDAETHTGHRRSHPGERGEHRLEVLQGVDAADPHDRGDIGLGNVVIEVVGVHAVVDRRDLVQLGAVGELPPAVVLAPGSDRVGALVHRPAELAVEPEQEGAAKRRQRGGVVLDVPLAQVHAVLAEQEWCVASPRDRECGECADAVARRMNQIDVLGREVQWPKEVLEQTEHADCVGDCGSFECRHETSCRHHQGERRDGVVDEFVREQHGCERRAVRGLLDRTETGQERRTIAVGRDVEHEFLRRVDERSVVRAGAAPTTPGPKGVAGALVAPERDPMDGPHVGREVEGDLLRPGRDDGVDVEPMWHEPVDQLVAPHADATVVEGIGALGGQRDRELAHGRGRSRELPGGDGQQDASAR